MLLLLFKNKNACTVYPGGPQFKTCQTQFKTCQFGRLSIKKNVEDFQ